MSRANYIVVALETPSFGLLKLRFADGLEDEVDVSEHIWGPVFERVRTGVWPS